MDYFYNTTKCLKELNRIQRKIEYSDVETTEAEDEFNANFPLYLAHALVKDYGTGGAARSELLRTVKIIIDLIDE